MLENIWPGTFRALEATVLPTPHCCLAAFSRSAASRAAMFWEAVTRCRTLMADLSRQMRPQSPCSHRSQPETQERQT